jgi:SAM-dependent methyltransferase
MPVTVADVKAAYQWILGRTSSDQENNAWLSVPSVDHLRRRFLSSKEFSAIASTMLNFKVPTPADAPPLHVDVEVPDDVLAQLIARISRAWTALGVEEPHWSVLSADRFKANSIAGNRKEFHASGEIDAKKILATLARHDLRADNRNRVCEYGCGVGRVTPYLARLFEHVTAIDISPSHIALARTAAGACDNVDFVQAELPEAGMKEPFDLWFSHIVLQHNPPPVIAMILGRMFAMLSPGGVAIFQVPTYAIGYSFDANKYLSTAETGKIEIHCLPQSEIFRMGHDAGCFPLEVIEDRSLPYPWLSQVFAFRKAS